MRDYFTEIIDNLEKQKAIYEKILEYSREMQGAIIDDAALKVSELTVKEQTNLKELIKLEKERTLTSDEYAKSIGIEPTKCTIQTLIENADGHIAQRLTRIWHEMQRIFREQKQINDANDGLIRTHLQYIGYMINVVAGEGVAGNTYGTPSDKNTGKVSKLFDTTV